MKSRLLKGRVVARIAMVAIGAWCAGASGFAQDRVTVEQLELRVNAGHGHSDKDLARRLGSVQLTERLSLPRLEKLRPLMPGEESQRALLAIADMAEVLELPRTEVPGDPPPAIAEQEQMLARAYKASESSSGELPDFNATAKLTRYRNLKYLSSGHSMPVPLVVPVPQMLDRDIDTVQHLEGRFLVTHASQTWVPGDAVKTGVESWEGIYSLLANVLQDMRGANPAWARWEQGSTGRLAVFGFSVDEGRAHFPIHTQMEPAAKRGYKGNAGYRAEVAVDPGFVASAIQVAPERVSVDRLEKMVSEGSVSDHDLAQRLSQIELNQRLTADGYARIGDGLPGRASRDALQALYDMSEFEDLAAGGKAEEPAPDRTAQARMVNAAVDFVAGVIHKLPDLFATRDLARFEDLRVVRGSAPPVVAETRPLTVMDRSTGTVRFSEGREVVDSASNGRGNRAGMGLDTWGTFGPILQIVMADVLKAKLGWSHWEHGPSGRLAVFRYEVPEDVSHFEVRFCCYLGEQGLLADFRAKPGYHGELTIDPETGAVMRLVLKDLKMDPLIHVEEKTSPLLRSEVLVEYGAVEIAGKRYVCPTRMVSLMTSWTLGGQGPVKQKESPGEWAKAAKKALEKMEFSRVDAINEAVFREYHAFQSDMRIVPN